MAKSIRDKALRVLKKLPTLSAGTSRFLAALSKRDVESSKLTSVIEADPMLAPNVLQLANSGVFGRLRRIESVKHAVALLGPFTLRRYALGWTFTNLWRNLQDLPRWSTARFTMHSEATALLTDIMCDHLPVANADGAFIAGLVHDIGKFVICAEAAAHIDFIMSLRELGQQSSTEIERNVLGIDHAELSAIAANNWGMTDDICHAIHCHHEPHLDKSDADLTLSFALYKADRFVNGLGLGYLSAPPDSATDLDLPGYEPGVEQSLGAFETAWKATGVLV